MECIRPNAMILAYPVILADAYVNEGSLACVSGAGKGSPEYLYFGLDKHVDAKTPPAFLWHTAEDTCVPVENSLYFALALSKEKIPFELHVFPEGSHGMSVCTKEVGTGDAYNGRWVEWSVRWLFKMFFLHKKSCRFSPLAAFRWIPVPPALQVRKHFGSAPRGNSWQ